MSRNKVNSFRPRYTKLQVARVPVSLKLSTGGIARTDTIGPAGVIGDSAQRKYVRELWRPDSTGRTSTLQGMHNLDEVLVGSR